MTYTTNYSLHKPETTDNFNISDFNANSDIIDKQFGITSANIPKVTCSTGASTVAKTATINGKFVLNRGARVLVTLSTKNTVASATFNLNSTGAKAILVNGASVTTDNLTAQTYLAEYDGSNWRFTTSTYTSDYARTASSATKLTTARKTYVTLGTASTTTTIDWSGDTTIPVNGTLGVTNGGTGQTDLANVSVGSATYAINLGTSSANYTKADLDNAIKSISRSSTTFTATRLDGSTFTFTQQDNNTIPSAYCSTSADTASKTASCSGYSLLSKSYIQVIVVNTNTSASALTLSINSKTAKPIYINGSASSASNYSLTAGSYLVYYDGTNYYFRTDGKITGSITGSANSASSATTATNVGKYNETRLNSMVCGSVTPTNYATKTAYSVGAYVWYENKLYRCITAVASTSTAWESAKWVRTPSLVNWYGTCSTDGATVAKTASITGFELLEGVQVSIKFTKANTATNTTLNINSTGAKAIYYHGTNVPNNIMVANATLNLVYNGTQYEIIGDLDSTGGGGRVTGVKGEAESTYRTGNVNITKENLGLTTDEMGMVWKDPTPDYTGSYSQPYYANGIWVIAMNGGNGGIKYSTDGKTWADSNYVAGYYTAPYYANGIWVIGDVSGTVNTGIQYSTDGKTWTNSNVTTDYYTAPYYANGIWVIGSSGGNGIKYSTDGKTWTNSNVTTNSYSQPYYANGIWVIGSSGNGQGGLKYSTDGKTWTNSNFVAGSFNQPYYANGIWVIGSSGGNGIKYSTDGKTWTTSNITTYSFNQPYYANGIWVIGGKGIKYSTDGKTWTDSNITTNSYNQPYYANGIWVIGSSGGNGNGIKYSTDGKTWTNSNITTNYYTAPYYANGIWVIGSSGDGFKYSTFNSLNDLGSAFKGITELSEKINIISVVNHKLCVTKS